MKKKEKHPPVLHSEIFKSMKTGKDLDEFIRTIYKQGVETLLNAEMDDHLGYEKNSNRQEDADNIRNGTSSKTIKTDFRDVELDSPRDRHSTFKPVIKFKISAL